VTPDDLSALDFQAPRELFEIGWWGWDAYPKLCTVRLSWGADGRMIRENDGEGARGSFDRVFWKTKQPVLVVGAATFKTKAGQAFFFRFLVNLFVICGICPLNE
jgi:hypothetical protein